MEKIFDHMVKYNGEFYAANQPIEIPDKEPQEKKTPGKEAKTKVESPKTPEGES